MSFCGNCGHKLDDAHRFCTKCGTKVAHTISLNKETSAREETGAKDETKPRHAVKIFFPVWPGQAFMNKCYVYDSNGNTIVLCKQGENVTFRCDSPMTISVKMQNCFGQPKQLVQPGEHYKVGFNPLGFIHITKVDGDTP